MISKQLDLDLGQVEIDEYLVREPVAREYEPINTTPIYDTGDFEHFVGTATYRYRNI